MSVEGLRLVLRMKLTTNKPGMCFARQLNHLDKLSVGRNTAEDQTFSFEYLAKLGIAFITMTMKLAAIIGALVHFLDRRAWREFAGPGAEAHRAAEFFNTNQVTQFEDNWMRRFQIKLSRISVLEITNIPCILDASCLHSQA